MFDKLADFEREMFELQKNHRFNIRELLEEAENKMTEMKSAHHNEMKVLVRFVVREETNFGFYASFYFIRINFHKINVCVFANFLSFSRKLPKTPFCGK